MKYRIVCLAVTLLFANYDWVNSGRAEAGDDFSPLFNGRDLTGWHGDNPHTTVKAKPGEREQAIAAQQAEFLKHWHAEDGELVNDGNGPYATTDREFGDIELLIDYKTVAKADSGIYLRGTPQIQIWDSTEAGGKWERNADKGSGGLFNNTHGQPGQLPLVLADQPFGEWNHFRILQIGARTWVELNHKLVVDGAIMENYWDKDRVLPLPARGPIHLQTHGGEIRWKNILTRDIDADEAISRLRGDDAKAGFVSLFNGKDLAGWQGAVDDYEVVDGAIVCKPGQGGVLFTQDTYDDFVVRVEFNVPSGGNNGLAIRYPGHGRPAYDGMCELQILDDQADKFAGLDPRQFHGSVYGVAPAHRGYLRPAGQWNYQEVTVQGSQIRVELNGTIILDTDVTQWKDFKDDAKHPGLQLAHGHFGLAGHKDPVRFRNIAIKRLPRSSETASQPPAKNHREIAEALLAHASFDGSTELDVFAKDRQIYTAASLKRNAVQPGNHIDSVAIARGQGRYGDCLQFTAKSGPVLFYQGTEAGYQAQNWSGSFSVWLKLDPNKDLEPGFCDPIQITQRGWNDAALFVDFDKELPRDFRLGVFGDYKSWNPDDTKWDDVPVAARPMITVKHPPFDSAEWTHVCFTWDNINAADNAAATTALYLNGQPHGKLVQPMQFTWEPEKAAIMLGINYIGLMDELMLFNRALSAEQVAVLFSTPLSQLR